MSVLDRDGDVRDVLAGLAKWRKNARKVRQRDLRANIDNWNFITWEPALAKLYKHYQKHSESIAIYSEHRLAETRFGARFYFDVGFILDRSKESATPNKNVWGLVDFRDFLNFSNFRPNTFYPCTEDDIQLPKNSQGYEALYRRHKLLWEKSRKFKFYYTDADVVPSMSHCQIISSHNRDETLFLFAVLNASITRYLFEARFSLGNEKVGMFVVVSRLKEFVRPPSVDTPQRSDVKRTIIALVEKALDMEKPVLGDFVEIDTLVRRVDNVRVQGHELLVTHRGGDLSFPIVHGAVGLVEAALRAWLNSEGGLFDHERSISVRDLKALPAFDRAAQLAVLREVDEQVLNLYRVPERERIRLRKWHVE